VTTGASCAKLQSNHETNKHFLQAGCPSCRPTNSVKALKGNRGKTESVKVVTVKLKIVDRRMPLIHIRAVCEMTRSGGHYKCR